MLFHYHDGIVFAPTDISQESSTLTLKVYMISLVLAIVCIVQGCTNSGLVSGQYYCFYEALELVTETNSNMK